MWPKFALSIALAALISLAWPHDNAAAKPKFSPPVTAWAPEAIAIEISQGTATIVPLALVVSQDVLDASLFVTPSLSRYLRIDAPDFTMAMSGASIEFQVRIEVRAGTSPGAYSGTIHLRSRNRTLPAVLHVTIEVTEPTFDVVPTSPAVASSDRIVRDDDGQFLVGDELVVIIDSEYPNPDQLIRDIAAATGGVILGSVPETRSYQLRFMVGDLDVLLAKRDEIQEIMGVDSASRVFLSVDALAAVPNDTQYTDAWDEANPSGDNYGLEVIRAPSAWDITTGNPAIVVGVIDGDFDVRHSDLDGNVIERVGGRTTSYNGHGTHVSGIIGAEGNNVKGVVGLNWTTSLRLYDFPSGFSGGTSAIQAQAAMVRAVRDGVRVVNMSLQWIDNNQCGKPGTAATEAKVAENNAILAQGILYALRQDREILWVFAAGNECRDAKYASPASLVNRFPLQTIAVASVDPSGTRSSFSNFGDLITVAAPGLNVLSTVPRRCVLFIFCFDQYDVKSGTSMAAPFVTGLAALVLAEHPEFTTQHVKQCIVSGALSSGRGVPGHDFRVIDAPAAIQCLGTLPLPPQVDIVFSLDLTGSMGAEINRIKAEVASIVTRLETAAPLTDFQFGIVSYEDYAGIFDSRPCGSGYFASYGTAGTKPGGDAPFRVDLALASDTGSLVAAINGLQLGFGGDGPQSYGRVYFEVAQSDTGAALGFRSGALKILIDFGDNVPHDSDLNKDIFMPPFATLDTGVDPGRNNVVDCGGDDIDFQDGAIQALVDAGIRLVHIDSSGSAALAPYWQKWTSDTGGAFAVINSDGSLPPGTDLGDLIISLLALIPM